MLVVILPTDCCLLLVTTYLLSRNLNYIAVIFVTRSIMSSYVNTKHILLYLISVLEEDVLLIQNETSSFVAYVYQYILHL